MNIRSYYYFFPYTRLRVKGEVFSLPSLSFSFSFLLCVFYCSLLMTMSISIVVLLLLLLLHMNCRFSVQFIVHETHRHWIDGDSAKSFKHVKHVYLCQSKKYKFYLQYDFINGKTWFKIHSLLCPLFAILFLSTVYQFILLFSLIFFAICFTH